MVPSHVHEFNARLTICFTNSRDFLSLKAALRMCDEFMGYIQTVSTTVRVLYGIIQKVSNSTRRSIWDIFKQFPTRFAVLHGIYSNNHQHNSLFSMGYIQTLSNTIRRS